jgi:hypothetical protein
MAPMTNHRGPSMKKQPLISILALAALAFGGASAQHDSLSCRTVLTGMLRRKADMQTLNEYDPETFAEAVSCTRRSSRRFWTRSTGGFCGDTSRIPWI